MSYPNTILQGIQLVDVASLGGGNMTEKPGWINDQPVTMEIDGLRSFANYIQQELDLNVRPNVEKVLGKLGPPENLTFGASGEYHQGRVIGNYHSAAIEAGRKLMASLRQGLQAIAWASHNIANDYESADELNRMDLTRVDGYFNPTDRSRVLDRSHRSEPPPAYEG
jgi:hypothetical protein